MEQGRLPQRNHEQYAYRKPRVKPRASVSFGEPSYFTKTSHKFGRSLDRNEARFRHFIDRPPILPEDITGSLEIKAIRNFGRD